MMQSLKAKSGLDLSLTPVIFSAAAGKPMSGSYAPPLDFWQSRQWQLPIKIGSAEHS
jgi:hypothetical protein